MRCGVITLFVCGVSLPSAFTQNTTLAINEEITTTKPEFTRIQLGPFSQLAHGLRSGPITIIDKNTFLIPDLYYDGKGPDAHFWAGNGSAPSSGGILVSDENGSNKSLPAYDGQTVTIRLPNNLTVDQIDYLSLWCIEFNQNFGDVVIPRKGRNIPGSPTPNQEPLGVELEPFKQLAHGLRSGPIVIVDKKTFFIPNLHYDGKGPDAHFWVGNGSQPSPTGILVPDENGSSKSIAGYSGQNIYITLPDGVTVDKIDYLGVWCIQYKHNFGHVIIPKNIKMPEPKPDPRFTGDNKMIFRIQKCCPRNEVLSTSGCKAENQPFDPRIDVHVHNSTHINDEPLAAQSIRFEPYVNHIDCEYNQYPLIPDDDKFALLQNGSLLVLNTKQILSLDNYCMETVDFGDEQQSDWITTAIVCFSSAEVPLSNTLFVIYAVGVALALELLCYT